MEDEKTGNIIINFQEYGLQMDLQRVKWYQSIHNKMHLHLQKKRNNKQKKLKRSNRKKLRICQSLN